MMSNSKSNLQNSSFDFKDMKTLPAYAVLKKLAAAPFDLTFPNGLNSKRLSSYVCRSKTINLLYATQRVDDTVLNGLQQLADESSVIDQFIMMKNGAVLNQIKGYDSENHQVLHTAVRDIFTASPLTPAATAQAKDELKKLELFLNELDNNTIKNKDGQNYTNLVHIGIGGSDLGPCALYLALAAYSQPQRQVHFISNVDPDDASAILQKLDLSRTLVNVVSKSGTTLETMTNEELARQAFIKAGLEPCHHFLAVTGRHSPMDNPDKYLRSFYMFDYIGGRYSVTSMVGAVMLGFTLGIDGFYQILKGAHDMDKIAENRNILKNPPLLLALLGIWNHNFMGHETTAILPYSQGLSRFAAHLQQCDMESNGKSINRMGHDLACQSGPIIWGEPGTNGQHAFYQLLHQGTTIVPVEFIGFRQSQYQRDLKVKKTTSQQKLIANMLAQAQALALGQKSDNPNQHFKGNRPSSILLADRLTPYTMGALLALYEAKVVFQGFIWNINSFDQEGVQLGKVLANRLLNHFTAYNQDKSYDGTIKDEIGWGMLQAAGLI